MLREARLKLINTILIHLLMESSKPFLFLFFYVSSGMRVVHNAVDIKLIVISYIRK